MITGGGGEWLFMALFKMIPPKSMVTANRTS
jgi:hypothetical protein